nr:MAG TPA: hypothetical protein [Caudoviricetes sp.]
MFPYILLLYVPHIIMLTNMCGTYYNVYVTK